MDTAVVDTPYEALATEIHVEQCGGHACAGDCERAAAEQVSV